MFDVSFTELLVIGVVALVVIGPERLPKVARTVGHLVGRAQRYVNDVKSDIQREVELDELRKLKDQMQDAAQTVKTSLNETESSLRKPLESFEQETMSVLKDANPVAEPAAASAETPPAVSAPESAPESAPQTTAQSAPTPAPQPAQVSANPAQAETTPRASVSVTNSASATAQAAAAEATPPAEFANMFDTPISPKQLELDGVATGVLPEPLSLAERAAQAEAQAKAIASTPKPGGTPT